MVNKKDISCPICDKHHTWTKDNKFKPFCSERCKLIDLGQWADEKRSIPGNSVDQNEIEKNDETSH